MRESAGENREVHVTNKTRIAKGLESGQYYQGTIRVSTGNHKRSFVSVDALKADVLIDGLVPQNCSLDGDTVIIEMIPAPLWPANVVKPAQPEKTTRKPNARKGEQ